MEPKQSGTVGGVERAPVVGSSPESFYSPESGNFDVAGEQSHEQQPPAGDAHSEPAQVVIPSLPMPVVTQPVPQQAAATASDDDTPISANDDDLIEKEWVDKAKKILSETKDDPHRRESEVSKLQVEYIRKRYGREIGVTDE
ncbi:hypothetical protein EOL96_05285 [Candidatus Saccharibacteria bacterium]|nr:hypothetical protein [Candidatus Saccharibacteria bacterium]